MISHNPLVSIIIPVYNSELYLEEAIKSCLNQSYSNIEIIIIDDGSEDNSFNIAKEYESEQVRVITQQNTGACAARNKGIDLSNGEYIQFLDSDDIISPQKIENQLNILNKEDESVIGSSSWIKFNESINNISFSRQFLDQDWNSPIEWLLNSWNGYGMGLTNMWLTPKKLLEKAGRWNEKLLVNQDGEFFNRVLLHASSINFCETAYAYYRSGENQVVSRVYSQSKAKSLLLSYQLYVENTLKFEDSNRVRCALCNNFLMFIYQYYEKYPELVKEAKNEMNKLGIRKLKPVGGKNFKNIAKIIGFENTLNIRKILMKIK